jgi:hypothetical protein
MISEPEFSTRNKEFIGEKVVTRLDLCCSVMLRRAECQFVADVSGKPVRPIFKGQTVEEGNLS